MDQTTTPIDEHVASEVRAELGRQSMSKAALARELGVTWIWVDRRLKAQVSFTVPELEGVAEVLNVDLAQFLRPRLEAVEPKVPRPRATEQLPAGEQLEI